MITYSDINEAITAITEKWGDAGRIVVANAFNSHHKMGMDEFLSHCTMCDGDWGGMFLTGIRELYPSVYEAIPDNMGIHSFTLICYTLMLCGVDTSE